MPPSHRSHSSHHSSHHSHHSHTSHHGSSSYSSTTYRPTRTVTKSRQVPRPDRQRENQPQNYTGTRLMRKHKCHLHDYHYYGDSWIDSKTGTEYKRGYYDEQGNRYDALIIENNGRLESQFDCRYCGTSTKEVWTEGSIPHCPNCGALLIETGDNVIKDTIDNSFVTQTYQEEVPIAGRNNSGILVNIVTIVAFFAVFIGGIIPTYLNSKSSNNSSDDHVVQDNLDMFGSSFYVQSIGRAVIFNHEYESYYDPTTDCYLIYNTEVEPAVWQYWYEDISSDFGDYGWMEYELDEDQWYIETSNNNWVELPSRYDTSNLWYITGNLAGTSYSQDYDLEMLGQSIRVDDGTAYYSWNDVYGGYEVPEHNCYIYVNYDVNPASIQYWNEEYSPRYSEDGYGGWLEYNYEENVWYVNTPEGDWVEFYAINDELWHVQESITGYTGTIVEAN